jgi:excisionase family DNA binding protein
LIHNVIPLAGVGPAAGATARLRATRAVYTVREVAELLSLSLGSTYALIRSGEIPALKLGGRWVVPKKRFHAWLNASNLDEPRSASGGGARWAS